MDAHADGELASGARSIDDASHATGSCPGDRHTLAVTGTREHTRARAHAHTHTYTVE